MRKIALAIAAFFAALIFLAVFFWNDLAILYNGLNLKLPQIQKEIVDFVQEAEKKIITPPPLASTRDSQNAFLTVEGIIQETNLQREKYGFPNLKENSKLDVSAEAKIEDMFKNQYFAHESPLGFGVGDLADAAGYEFIVIGENLAMGSFEDDSTLVQAWMDSLGHRENILNDRYEEIGVAVRKGIFEGRETWLAVQHFALPLSACSQPNIGLKAEIEENQSEIERLYQELLLLEAEIAQTRPKSGLVYRQKIEEYNGLVAQYNELLSETASLINTYNIQIKVFNNCIVSG